jgi:hypothetical protein
MLFQKERLTLGDSIVNLINKLSFIRQTIKVWQDLDFQGVF